MAAATEPRAITPRKLNSMIFIRCISSVLLLSTAAPAAPRMVGWSPSQGPRAAVARSMRRPIQKSTSLERRQYLARPSASRPASTAPPTRGNPRKHGLLGVRGRSQGSETKSGTCRNTYAPEGPTSPTAGPSGQARRPPPPEGLDQTTPPSPQPNKASSESPAGIRRPRPMRRLSRFKGCCSPQLSGPGGIHRSRLPPC